MTSKRKFGVGIVGLQPGRSWAAVAHLPALRALAADFDVVGVANSSRASAEAAAAECGLPRAFASVADLVRAPEVDIVTVTVKVPAHLEIVRAALDAGKHVFCEWPVGRTLDEAEALAALTRERGVLAVSGNQSRPVPAMRHLRQLVESGFVGEVLSSRIVGYGRIWGATVEDVRTDAYLLDAASGATMLTIPVAHTLAALRDVLGDVTDVSAMLATRRREVRGETTAELLAMDAPDEVLIHATLSGGAPLSLHYTGGMPRGVDGFVWDIHGTEGDLRATAETGHTQVYPLVIHGGRGDDRTLRPLEATVDAPNEAAGAWRESPVSGNVARIYQRMAADLRHGSSSAPTFDDALTLHRLIAAVEQSARERRTIAVDAPNRPLPAI